MPSVGGKFQFTTLERREVGEHDVQIDIKFAGICHTDIHQAKEGLGRDAFPMVPGHEIAGTVSAIGSGVTRFAIGDRVGVGCFVDSCNNCDACREGEEQFCEKGPVSTYNGIDYEGNLTYGGYSEMIVVSDRFVVRVPDALSLESAAPLLCAGITLYSPLRRLEVGPNSKVAIIGLGGLGHLGVQLAHAMGAEVTVLSQSATKRDDAIALGAKNYLSTRDEQSFSTMKNAFDAIISTAPMNLAVDAYLALLRRHGTLLYVGAPPRPETFSVNSLLWRGRAIAGSMVGGVAETQEMLDFCADHGIVAMTETVGAEDVDSAYDRVVANDVRFRFVIDIATLHA
jgi:uncharacterized zinc-type alcohol dehydrogenase-like protein